MSSLKVLIVDANKNVSRVYLKREDIETVTFGTEVVKNPNYDSEVEGSVESQSIEFCKIQFYRRVDVEQEYESITKDKKGVEHKTLKKRTVSIPDYWATSDKEQFEFIENWAQNSL